MSSFQQMRIENRENLTVLREFQPREKAVTAPFSTIGELHLHVIKYLLFPGLYPLSH